jgi:hypothetical protein
MSLERDGFLGLWQRNYLLKQQEGSLHRSEKSVITQAGTNLQRLKAA